MTIKMGEYVSVMFDGREHFVSMDKHGRLYVPIDDPIPDERSLRRLAVEVTKAVGFPIVAFAGHELSFPCRLGVIYFDRIDLKILDQSIGERFSLYHGDNVEVIRGIPDDSIGLTVTSVPFPAMYTYTNTSRDIGNTSGIVEMLEHFRYVADGLLRATMPGRSACIHLTQSSLFKHRDGVIGRLDFRGDMIRLMQDVGWIYASEVAIDKDPQLRAVRAKDRGLLFKSLATDSSVMAPVMLDYVLSFRKPGDNPRPIRAGKSASYGNQAGWITEDEWIEWAHGVWYRWRPELNKGIRETDVLNVSIAREDADERHLCPLQLGVIERCVKLWSAPDDVVLDPFSGIGSTGVRALELGRRYVGMELKESYYRQSIKYLKRAESMRDSQRSLFDAIEAAESADVHAS